MPLGKPLPLQQRRLPCQPQFGGDGWGLDTITTPEISESQIGTDLNGDGVLSRITKIKARHNYVGDANGIKLAHELYPENTEFLHTVRYIGVDEQGNIFNAPRMKEVRYMKKHNFKSKQSLGAAYYREAKEKAFENYPQTLYLGDQGINNNQAQSSDVDQKEQKESASRVSPSGHSSFNIDQSANADLANANIASALNAGVESGANSARSQSVHSSTADSDQSALSAFVTSA